MATEDFLRAYKELNAKLKKRRLIVRKVNFADSKEQLARILGALKREGNHQYAAFCLLAMARCEQAMKNSSLEATLQVEAGDLFWTAEREGDDIDYVGFEENLVHALDCYLSAIRIYQKQRQWLLVAGLYHELGSNFRYLRKYAEAADYFTKAADIYVKTTPLNTINSLLAAAECYIYQRNIHAALEALRGVLKSAHTAPPPTDMPGTVRRGQYDPFSPPPYYTHVIVESRVAMVLLHALARSFGQAREVLALLDERAGPAGTNAVVPLLTNLVMAAEYRDRDDFEQAEIELQHYLTPLQREVLQMLARDVAMAFKPYVEEELEERLRPSPPTPHQGGGEEDKNAPESKK